jgi:hypothetical protein
LINRFKIVVKGKAKAIYNIIICIVFIKIGIFLIITKSNLKILDLPLYPTIGILAVVVNSVLLIKWIGRFHKPKNN